MFWFLTDDEANSLRAVGCQLVRCESHKETVFIDVSEVAMVRLHCDGCLSVRGPLVPKITLALAPIVERLKKECDS